MSIQKHMSLSQAAKLAGVTSKTIKRWLADDLGICFPKVGHGAKLLVLERDVERVLARRRDARELHRQIVGA